MDDFCGSQFWNDSLTWYTNGSTPDVTVCFQNSVLAWIPCVLIWVLSPLEAYYLLTSQRSYTPWTWLNCTKIVTTMLCLLVCVVEFLFTGVQGFINNKILPDVYFYTPFIKSATMFLVMVFTLAEKRKGFQSSGIIFNFWLVAFLCGLLTYRSLFLRNVFGYRFNDSPVFDDHSHLQDVVFHCYMIYYPLVGLNLVLNFFSDAPPILKRKVILKIERESPEKGASFPSRMLFSWFTSLVLKGFKQPLEVAHLWVLNQQDRSVNVAREFDKNWQKELRSKNFETESTITATFPRSSGSIDSGSNGPFSSNQDGEITFNSAKSRAAYNNADNSRMPNVVNALVRTYWPMLVLGAGMKLIHDIFQFVQPQLLILMIGFIEDPSIELWKGVLFASLMFITASLQSIALSVYFHRVYVVGMRMRTALISAVYRKSLVLSNSARKTTTTGEVINLMSNDAQKFMELMVFVNMIWSAPLQIALAVYFLWQILGLAVLSGLAVMVLMIPINGWLASMQKKLQTDQMKFKDDRIRLMNEIFSGIKVLKLYAWELSFQDLVKSIRCKEIAKLKEMAYLNAGLGFLWTCAPFLVSLASFLTYVLLDKKNVLDPKKAFVSLTLFHILRFPLSMLPLLISMLIQAAVSVKRINNFLNLEELDLYVARSSSRTSPVSISVEKGTFAWSNAECEQPTLHDITLRVGRGKLVAIVGQVGCGKSSLLSAILGDMEKIGGEVEVHGKLAYVAQQTWIQNTTVRENVLFNRPFEAKRYDAVIDACALRTDLQILPGGDETEIGEKGINLSGGQKQRISLARACYSDADVFLFDDPLSAVDSHVGKHIFDKVIGNSGYLAGRTRVLVTHGISFLPHVDHIVVLGDGRIQEEGTYRELLAKKGVFADVLMQFIQAGAGKEDSVDETEVNLMEDTINEVQGAPLTEDEISEENPDCVTGLRKPSRCVSQDKSTSNSRLSFESSGHFSRRVSISQSSNVKAGEQSSEVQQKLIQAEMMETGKVQWSVYLSYFAAMGYIWVFTIVLFNILSNLFALFSNIWLSEWSNDRLLADGTQDIHKRNQRLIVYGLLGLGQGLTILVASLALALGSLNGAEKLHSALLYNVLRSPMSFFDTMPIGRLVNRFSKDIDTVDLAIPQTIRSWIMCFLQVVVTLAIISFNAPIFLAVIVPVGALYYGIQVIYIESSRQLKRLESITRSPIFSHFSETLAGINTIRAYQKENVFVHESNNRVDINNQCYYPSTISNRWLAIRLEFCGNLIVLTAALFTVYYRSYMDGGKVGLMLSYALSVTATLNWMVRMSSEVETSIVSVERIVEYTHSDNEAEWRIEGKKPPFDWPSRGKIDFQKYATRYRNGLELVIKDITAVIEPGEKVGIVGRTGAGKSTLTLALFRLIEPAKGRILIDDLDITQMGLHDLREKLTIIPQDPVLFSGSMRMNLDPFERYSDADIWKALEQSSLKAFVSSLEKGLDHEVAEGGENLSVGQRQLMCLARSLLRKSRILVLDEATAAVDFETDELMQKTIRMEFRECTILTIAHRLNTIMDYDRIMVLDKGYIREFDTPANLLKKKNSIFYSMAKDANLVQTIYNT
ncbi:multidrug resistance-associated protein 1-like isoform X2 [Varroa jacobsoni]|uniref:multidrug resistance-associated protein 1-like isoform X2 n=1 Tax=Varroa jacobsoni TaxID=62625 RepID=UPI000BF69429|nr:multidrug resistance-associated protein 1-like isoform X2 [Varroa jacobsoni]